VYQEHPTELNLHKEWHSNSETKSSLFQNIVYIPNQTVIKYLKKLSVTELDYQTEMIIFGSILTTFESSSVFEGSWGSIENWLEPKTGNCPNRWNAL